MSLICNNLYVFVVILLYQFRKERDMNLIHKLEIWGDRHHPQWLDYFRIILGLIIFAKGVSFVNDQEAVRRLVEQTSFQLSIWGAVHYIVFTHLVGGIFIVLGFRTRLASLLILPVVMGAVFFINITNGFSFLNSELWLSIVVMLSLILFLIMGSGKYSLDNLMNRPGYKRTI